MKQASNDILLIRNNVFTLTPVLLSFYEGCSVKEDNLFLSLIIFPLLFNEKWIAQNPRINIKSKLAAWKDQHKLNLEGLPGRMEYFRDITIRCIQYAMDMKWIEIKESNVCINQQRMIEWKDSPFYQEQMECARNINKMIHGMDVVTIFATLDIKEVWKL